MAMCFATGLTGRSFFQCVAYSRFFVVSGAGHSSCKNIPSSMQVELIFEVGHVAKQSIDY